MEMYRSLSKKAFVKSLQQLIPKSRRATWFPHTLAFARKH